MLMQDTRKWVGTSEAAVLFRFSGYTAEIVDFELGKEHQTLYKFEGCRVYNALIASQKFLCSLFEDVSFLLPLIYILQPMDRQILHALWPKARVVLIMSSKDLWAQSISPY